MLSILRRLAFVVILSLALTAVAGATQGRPGDTQPGRQDEDPASEPIEVRISVSRTAVWVGDRTVYTVALICAPGVDVLLDDLLKERLQVHGGEILSTESARTEEAGRITYTLRYTLVTYAIDVTALTVAPLSVRYYAQRRGQRPGDAAPAGEVIIPPLVVALRSTIPESDAAIGIRPPGGVVAAPGYLRFVQPLGLALLLIAIVPAAIMSLGVARRLNTMRGAYASWRSRRHRGGSFAQITALQPASDAERLEAFGKLDMFVRDHFRLATSIPAQSLTPTAMRRTLESRTPGRSYEAVETVLATCERARYAPEPPSGPEWDETVREAEALVRMTRT